MRFALLLLCAAAFAQDTRVILLGTGNPNPDPPRMGPAVAVVSGPNVYRVDCGSGIVRRAAQAGIRMDQLTIFTPAVTGREQPLEVYGPSGLRSMTGHIQKAWKEDVDSCCSWVKPPTRSSEKCAAASMARFSTETTWM
jgi:ribonuclease Z